MNAELFTWARETAGLDLETAVRRRGVHPGLLGRVHRRLAVPRATARDVDEHPRATILRERQDVRGALKDHPAIEVRVVH